MTNGLMASNALGQLREAEGALNEASRVYEDGIQYAAEQHMLHTPYAALLSAGLGRVTHERNDLGAAVTYLDEALRHSVPSSKEELALADMPTPPTSITWQVLAKNATSFLPRNTGVIIT